MLSPRPTILTAMNAMTLHQYPNRAQVSNALIAYGVTAGLTDKLIENEAVHKLLSGMHADDAFKNLNQAIPANVQDVIKTIAPVFASVTCGLFAANVIMGL